MFNWATLIGLVYGLRCSVYITIFTGSERVVNPGPGLSQVEA